MYIMETCVKRRLSNNQWGLLGKRQLLIENIHILDIESCVISLKNKIDKYSDQTILMYISGEFFCVDIFFLHWICVDKQSFTEGACTLYYNNISIRGKIKFEQEILIIFHQAFQKKKCHVDDDMTLTLIKLPGSGS